MTCRVCYVSDERFPSYGADTQQIVKNAEALRLAGLQVELVIPRRAGRVFMSHSNRMQEIKEFYNLSLAPAISQLMTIPAGDFRPSTKLAHWFASSAFARLRAFDVLYTRHPVAAVLGLILGQWVVFETYRSWGDEQPFLVRTLSPLTKSKKFIGIISHSQFSADSMVREGLPEDRIVVMHNGFDPKDLDPVLSKTQARKMLGLRRDRPLMVYAGNMQKHKGMESILDLAKIVPMDFLLVGAQPVDRSRLLRYAKEKQISNVQIVDHKPSGELAPYLYAADMLIIPPSQKPLKDYGRTVLPLKVFNYLAAARPIIAPALPDTKELLVDDQNVCFVPADDPQGCAQIVNELLDDPKRQDRLANGAGQTASALTWLARGQKIKSWLLREIHQRQT